jgi:hypothetical protein
VRTSSRRQSARKPKTARRVILQARLAAIHPPEAYKALPLDWRAVEQAATSIGRIGLESLALRQVAEFKEAWTVIDMKGDWKTVFPAK